MARSSLCTMAAASTLNHLLASAAVLLVAASAYDCDAELWDWENLWTPDWKEWCCKHEQKGCPSTSTATLTTTLSRTQTRTATQTSTTTVTGNPCHTNCTLDGFTATCGARMKWVSEHDTRNEEDPCQAAQAIVAKSCPDHCDTCTPAAANHCQGTTAPPTEATTAAPATTPAAPATTAEPTTAPASTASASTSAAVAASTEVVSTTVVTQETSMAPKPPSTTPTPAPKVVQPCDRDCLVKGENSTCGNRMKWSSVHEFSKEKSPCEAAQVITTMQCDFCGACTTVAAGCGALVDKTELVKRFELQHVHVASDGGVPTISALLCMALCALVAGAIVIRARRTPGSRSLYVHTPAASTHEEELLEAMVEA